MPSDGNYLCGCGRFMRVLKNGVTVEELMDDGTAYRLWDADLVECPECKVRLISGFGRLPLSEHWHPDYAAWRERLQPVYPGRSRADGDTGAADGRQPPADCAGAAGGGVAGD